MRKNDAHEQNADPPPPVRSNLPEEGSEPVEEPNQRRQDGHIQRRGPNEKIRLVILGVALLAMILSFLVFLRTGTVLPLFVTMVVVYLCYRRIDRYLDTSERSLP
jgi:hypothetical protein